MSEETKRPLCLWYRLGDSLLGPNDPIPPHMLVHPPHRQYDTEPQHDDYCASSRGVGLCDCGLDDLRSKVIRLDREVYVLRLFGNKDCTAMADEYLEGQSEPKPLPIDETPDNPEFL